MFLRLPRKPIDADTNSERPCWMDILQYALDGMMPSDEKLEQFLDHYERMP